jgi:hypothetical protein
MTPAAQALSAIRDKDTNRFGLYLHIRHKDIIVKALEFYINNNKPA